MKRTPLKPPLGPVARRNVAEQGSRTLDSGGHPMEPRDVTDLLATGRTFLPRQAHRLQPGDRLVELVRGLLVRIPGRHDVTLRYEDVYDE